MRSWWALEEPDFGQPLDLLKLDSIRPVYRSSSLHEVIQLLPREGSMQLWESE
jgi:hypothetical protein